MDFAESVSTDVLPLRIAEAIDLFVGELARRGRSQRTLREYQRKLNLLADDVRDAARE